VKYFRLCTLIFILICGGCGQKNRPVPKYLFLITLDTTRADAIDYSLVDNDLTPNLAELASQGTSFQNAYSLIPITLPSHYSMFYSLSPHALKIYNNGQTSDIPYNSLAEILKEQGFQTGAVVSLASLAAKWGLDKGFLEYIEDYRKPYLFYKTAEEVNQDAFRLIKKFTGNKAFFWIHYSDPHEPYFSPKYTGKFIITLNEQEIFSSQSTERAFIDLEINLAPGVNKIDLVTQMPKLIVKNENVRINRINFEEFSFTFDAPEKMVSLTLPENWQKKVTERRTEYNTKKRRSKMTVRNRTGGEITGRLTLSHRLIPTKPSTKYLYQEEVLYMDAQIGKLIEFIKNEAIFEESAFLIMGDHGEGLNEYNQHIGHLFYLHKIYSKVPMILTGPGISKANINNTLVSNLNIAPTILEILKIKKPDFMAGTSLLNKGKNKKLLLETYSPEAPVDSFAIIDYPFQLIVYPQRSENKVEYYNLEEDEFGIINLIDKGNKPENFRELLKYLQKVSEELVAMKETKSAISERDREILRSLGYLR
jgi:arylsulfatase A-like enzyme